MQLVNASHAITNVTTTPRPRGCVFLFGYMDIIRTAHYLFGIICNVLLLAYVAKNGRLKNYTFIVIASMGLADLVFLLFSLIFLAVPGGFYDKETLVLPNSCPEIISGKYLIILLDIIINTGFIVSAFHITYLMFIRYLVLAKPFWVRQHTTAKKVVIGCGCLWISGVALSSATSYGFHDGFVAGVLHIAMWVINYPTVLLSSLWLHVIKVRSLRSSPTIKDVQIRKMNLRVSFILFSYAIFPLPWNLLEVIYYFRKDLVMTYDVWFLCGLMLVSNNCVNPLIFGLLSDTCKNALNTCCCYCCRRFKRRSVVTETPENAPQGEINIAMDTRL
ncbi:Galanin receptor type 2 [Mizuhopecten yessoensis]|uniref:Galanin receptor type 2 n=1 Tax=Mizuhopecten yessoensis TaxID=6573 RepID=A0A210QDY9_MIZYE|nr:Galanin receptor type 2 [Mizuhopecten yessoensis]